MLHLVDRGMVPPGGFKFLVSETATTITAASFLELVHAVKRHRSANGLHVTATIESEVEHGLCETLPTGSCMHADTMGSYESRVRTLSLAEVVSATLSIGEFLLRGREKVSQEEADRRAKICSTCPFNLPAGACTTCSHNTLREAVVKIVGAAQTTSDSVLHTCYSCGCTLKAAVWMPLDILQRHAGENLKTLPAWCWKKPL
jgi:hypothetical protein